MNFGHPCYERESPLQFCCGFTQHCFASLYGDQSFAAPGVGCTYLMKGRKSGVGEQNLDKNHKRVGHFHLRERRTQ